LGNTGLTDKTWAFKADKAITENTKIREIRFISSPKVNDKCQTDNNPHPRWETSIINILLLVIY